MISLQAPPAPQSQKQYPYNSNKDAKKWEAYLADPSQVCDLELTIEY